MEKYDEICVESIDLLMDIFYAKIRADKSGVGEVFNNKIGTEDILWEKHKRKIANFWYGMLLNIGDYSGAPLKAHLDLPLFQENFYYLVGIV